MSPRVPDVLVERLLAGELSADEAARVRARLEAEPGGLARLDALRRSNEQILAELPAPLVAREVRARAARQEQRPRPWWVMAPALVMVAVALVVVRAPPPQPVEPDATVRPKGDGGAKVFVHRQNAGGHELLADGAEVAPGDVLQLGYASGGALHGVLLSVDGRGVVTLHQPPTPGGNTLLDGGGEVVLPRAYALDDAPGDEVFVFVTDGAPLDPFAVRAQAERGGADTTFRARDGRPLDAARLRVTKAAP